MLLLIHTPLRTYTARARITYSMRTLNTSPHISHLRGSRSLAPQMYLKLHDRHIAHAVSTTQAHRHLIAHRAIESSSKVVHIYEFMCRVRGGAVAAQPRLPLARKRRTQCSCSFH